jgi:DNA-binding transcriptional regulator YiaG
MPVRVPSRKKPKSHRRGHENQNATVSSATQEASRAYELRRRLQLNQPLFARLLAVSVRSLATLESGAAPTDAVARRLNELGRLTDALEEVMRNEAIGRWLQTPNAAFSDLKPLEVIDRGETDRIWAMIYFLRSGVPA